MPRKQRFKPSRKPKPIIPPEDANLERQPSSAPSAFNDNVDPREIPQSRNESPSPDPDSNPPSR